MTKHAEHKDKDKGGKKHMDQIATVAFTGTQTIARAEEARKRLLDALASQPPKLTVDCHDVEECDLTFVQILMAARRSCREGNRGLHLVGSPALAAACTAAGVDVDLLVANKGE